MPLHNYSSYIKLVLAFYIMGKVRYRLAFFNRNTRKLPIMMQRPIGVASRGKYPRPDSKPIPLYYVNINMTASTDHMIRMRQI